MIRKELWHHLFPLIIFLSLISLIHWPMKFSLIFFWIGGVLGTFLVDLDHLIYVLLRRPHELTSQRFFRFVEQGYYWSAFLLLVDSHRERKELIIHTAFFQVLFTISAFWILTSSSDIFGKGIVFGIFLHMLADQAFDFKEVGDLRNWFWQFKSRPEKQVQVIYFWVLVFLFLIFSLLWV